MPHFGHYNVTYRLTRKLLALIRDGCLWIEDRIPIDAALMHQITSLPMSGPNPLEHMGKKYEGETAEFVRQNYHVDNNTLGFIIKTISDQGTQLGTMLLACKMMRNCQVTSFQPMSFS